MTVLTVPDEGKVNGMTVNWVQMGWLWNKAVVTVYVRPQRHTYPLIEQNECFSLAFFDDDQQDKLAYLGKASGKEADKLAHVGYTTTVRDGAPCIDQARLVLVLKKLAAMELTGSQFVDKTVEAASDPHQDYHKAYTCEIVAAYQKEA
ncbi:MAG: flavin reductase family protein [Holdemania massiliensis]